VILAGYTIPNPTEIGRDMGRVAAANMTYGGLRLQWLVRYYASANPNPGTTPAATIALNRITLTWGGLGASELAALQNGFDAASINYVLLQCPELGLTYNNVANQAMVTVDPASPGLAIAAQQGYTGSGEGPLVYDAQAAFLVQTFYE
jgi:hypothetical protein